MDYIPNTTQLPPGFSDVSDDISQISRPSTSANKKLSTGEIILIVVVALIVLFIVIYFPVMYAPRPKPAVKTDDAELAGSGLFMQGYRRALPSRVNASLLGLGAVRSPDALLGPLVDSPDTLTLRMPVQQELPSIAPPPSDVEPFINADMALMFLRGKDVAIIILVSPGCGACHRLRDTLKSLRTNGALHPQAKLGLLSAEHWKAVKDHFHFDLHSVPTLFKVSNGKVHEHRVGNMAAHDLKEFVNKA